MEVFQHLADAAVKPHAVSEGERLVRRLPDKDVHKPVITRPAWDVADEVSRKCLCECVQDARAGEVAHMFEDGKAKFPADGGGGGEDTVTARRQALQTATEQLTHPPRERQSRCGGRREKGVWSTVRGQQAYDLRQEKRISLCVLIHRSSERRSHSHTGRVREPAGDVAFRESVQRQTLHVRLPGDLPQSLCE